MADPIISIQSVSKQFGEHQALNDVSLDIYYGEFLTLLGPSGCGKTTLLRLLSGFETQDSGKIFIQGRDITDIPPEERHINMVFQSYALFPHMTIYENVAFGLECEHCDRASMHERVMEALTRVKLAELKDRKPGQLSGGQQQRVAMARAIVKEPVVLLLDEPLSALDYSLRKQMRIKLKALQRRLGITFILVTHDQEEALSMSDRIAVMNHGRIEQIGTPRDVYEEPKNLFVTHFVGEANIFETEVIAATGDKITVDILGRQFELKNRRQFQAKEAVNVIIRPEDLDVWDAKDVENKANMLPGTVHEVIYKGSTVDLVIKLENDQRISATTFFDEDDEKLEYHIGQAIYVDWKIGWEVTLPNENE